MIFVNFIEHIYRRGIITMAHQQFEQQLWNIANTLRGNYNLKSIL